VERWIAEFLSYLKENRRCSPLTERAYGEEMRRFAEFAASRLKREPSVPKDLTPELVAAFAAARSLERTAKKRPIASRTLARSVAAVRSFLRYVERRGHSTTAARTAMPRVSTPDTLPASVPETSLNALLDELAGTVPADDVRGLRGLAAAECLYGAGLRVGELAGLTRGRLDERRKLVRVLGKGSKERVVPISDRAVNALKRFWTARGKAPEAGDALLRAPRGAASRRARWSGTSSRSSSAWARARRRTPTRCATASPRISSTAAPTYAPSRSCSATAISARRRSTRT
jgi:integrase/recombinase XerC